MKFVKHIIGCADEHSCTENIPLQYYPLVNSTLFTIRHDTNHSSASWSSLRDLIAYAIRSGYLSSSLSVNGSRLDSDASKFNISVMESYDVLIQVIDFQYDFSNEGSSPSDLLLDYQRDYYHHPIYYNYYYIIIHVAYNSPLYKI